MPFVSLLPFESRGSSVREDLSTSPLRGVHVFLDFGACSPSVRVLIVPQARGAHDVQNAVIAGCLTGGMFGVKGGPVTAAMGCAGMAAFSGAIEAYIEHTANSD